ncbi:alkylation response protein AidB-like acyl-CoA dehydrogenase [Streptomyces sp. SAI-126]
MAMGKLCMSAYSLGVTRHALTVAVRHAHQRVTSGMTSGQRVPLFAQRAHHAPLVEALATTCAATLLQRAAVRRWAQAAHRGARRAGRAHRAAPHAATRGGTGLTASRHPMLRPEAVPA